MADKKIKDFSADIEELQNLLKSATRPKVKDILSIEIRKLETVLITLKETQSQPAGSGKTNQKSAATSGTITTRVRDYAWDQSDNFVKFYVTLKGVQELSPDAVTSSFSSNTLTLNVAYPDKNCIFSIENLLHEISTEKSYHKVKSDSVIVFCKKATESQKWSCVTAVEKKLKDDRENKYKMDDKANSDDPSAGITNLMKKMYQEGDDDMKRTIAKAWTEGQSKKGQGMPDLPY